MAAEIGTIVDVAGIATNVHEVGTGSPLVLLHGSGPGVTALANWRLAIAHFAERRRVVAPDLFGFGSSDFLPDGGYTVESWVGHVVGLLDRLGIERADVVGNSFGGAIALHLATRHPHRVRRIVLMGSVGTRFELTPGLDAVWGYEPSPENMARLVDLFSYDASQYPPGLVESRYRASIRPGAAEAFGRMFPAPRQRWIDALAVEDARLEALEHEVLLIHGREDRVIPLASSLRLLERIPGAQLHVFGRCGHWVQLEQTERFHRAVDAFLTE